MSMAVDFDAIRHDYPLDAVVGQSRKLIKSGRNKLVICPFHPDRSPSLVLYPDQTYHCFGCGQHGDVLDYVAGTQHITISDAIRLLMLRVADERRLPFEVKVPNSRTRKAIVELETGKGKRFSSIGSLMEDLNEDD